MFENFANEFDTLARGAIAHVVEIDQNLKSAEASRNMKQLPDESTVAFRARVADADAKLEAARNAHKQMRFDYPGEVEAKTASMRTELEKAISDKFAARPSDVDHDVLTLLNSSVLTPSEYVRLFNDASNPTMKRLIAHSAGEAAEKLKDDREAASVLRNVANAGVRYSGGQFLAAFDGLRDILRRTIRNPAMSKNYGDLAAPFLEVFHR